MAVTDVVAQIQQVAAKVHDVDSASGRRLNELAEMVGQPELDRIAAVDLYGALDLEGIEDSAFARYQRRPGIFSVVEWVRNVLVLAPLCLTWYGLSQASYNYEKVINTPNLLQTAKPFLLLWQEGFKELGNARGLRFSEMASWDVFLLLAVLVLTAVVYWQKDVREAGAVTAARELRETVADALWEVNKLLASSLREQNLGEAVQGFERHAQVLVDELTEARGGWNS